MAWTTPRTWVAGETVTAALGNTHWRDNLNALPAAVSVITTTGTQTALSTPSGRGDLVIVANNASLLTIQGISAGFDGQSLDIIAINGQVDLANQNGSAAAADRIINNVTGTISLAGGGRVRLRYDDTNDRWRVTDHEQGGWITPTFSGSNFSTTGGGSWTVEAGDVSTYAYRLQGRSLTVAWRVVTSTTASSPTKIVIAIPNSLTAAKNTIGTHHWTDTSGGTNGAALCSVTASGTSIELSRDSTDFSNAFGNFTNTFATRGEIEFEVT